MIVILCVCVLRKAADGRGDPDQRRAPRGREANREDSGDETGSVMTISRIDARAIAVARFLNAAS
jgi:hypothetical protein